jgi:cobalt-zinc-cadmium efflux system outer membrane protein
MHRILAALLAATSCAAVAQAQERAPAVTGAPVLTLDDAVAAAGGSAPRLMRRRLVSKPPERPVP